MTKPLPFTDEEEGGTPESYGSPGKPPAPTAKDRSPDGQHPYGDDKYGSSEGCALNKLGAGKPYGQSIDNGNK